MLLGICAAVILNLHLCFRQEKPKAAFYQLDDFGGADFERFDLHILFQAVLQTCKLAALNVETEFYLIAREVLKWQC